VNVVTAPGAVVLGKLVSHLSALSDILVVTAQGRVKVNGKLLKVLQDVNTALLMQEPPDTEQILVVLHYQALRGIPSKVEWKADTVLPSSPGLQGSPRRWSGKRSPEAACGSNGKVELCDDVMRHTDTDGFSFNCVFTVFLLRSY